MELLGIYVIGAVFTFVLLDSSKRVKEDKSQGKPFVKLFISVVWPVGLAVTINWLRNDVTDE